MTKNHGTITNYQVRSKERISLQNSLPAILYYTEFEIDAVPVMQMIILISAADRHYLMTYTDLPEIFAAADGTILNEVYQSLISAQLKNPIGSRYDFPFLMMLAVGIVFILGLFSVQVRRKWHERSILSEDNLSQEHDELQPHTEMEEEEEAMKLVSHYSEAEAADGETWNDSDFDDGDHKSRGRNKAS